MPSQNASTNATPAVTSRMRFAREDLCIVEPLEGRAGQEAADRCRPAPVHATFLTAEQVSPDPGGGGVSTRFLKATDRQSSLLTSRRLPAAAGRFRCDEGSDASVPACSPIRS